MDFILQGTETHVCDWQSSLGKTGSHLASLGDTLNTVAIDVCCGEKKKRKRIAVLNVLVFWAFFAVTWCEYCCVVCSQTHALLERAV